MELTEAFLAKIAGWEAMKRARALLAADKVLSANWTPPVLKGVVQDGTTGYRAGLVIKDAIDIENMCSCRDSRQWGTICAHSVAVGLLHLQGGRHPALSPKPATLATEPPSLGKVAAVASNRNSNRCLRRAQNPALGEKLEIHVILPPNLAQAMQKSVIMVCLEGKWSGGRGPLSSLPKSTPFILSVEDAALLDHVEEVAGETPGMMQLNAEQFGSLLGRLKEYPRMTLGRSQELMVVSKPWMPLLRARLAKSGEIIIELKTNTQSSTHVTLLKGGAWCLVEGQIRPLGLVGELNAVLREPLTIPRTQIPAFLGQTWPRLLEAGCIEADFSLDDFTLEPQSPKFLLALQGGLAQLHAQLQCQYGQRIMTLGVTSATEQFWLPDPVHVTRYSTRDLSVEQAAQARLVRAGFQGPDAQGRWKLLGENAVLRFFARDFTILQREWEITLEERLERVSLQKTERVEPVFNIIPSGEDWFDLQVDFKTEAGGTISATEIQRLLRGGQSHFRLPNGKYGLLDVSALDDLNEVLRDCAPQQHGNGFRLANTQAAFLNSTLSAQSGWKVNAPSAWRQRFTVTGVDTPLEPPPLGQLDAVLRPYQKQGVGWLHFLRGNGFGGILADEMGLGKTLQLLALIQLLAEQKNGPCLIVCPTTLVYNWVAEAERFTPQLKVLAIQGGRRDALLASISQYDVVVTSYALMRRDVDQYRPYEFELVALDEAQHIKNRQTQNATAVKAIRARHRFVLTGTPMENSVLDLWSIFDFLMPGYLGTAQDFRERYEAPITRENDSAAQARLARRVRPFVLRRLKKEVVKDLPPKIEQISFCELTPQQAEVYRDLLEASKKEVLQAVESNGLARNRMLVFTTLLRLRQICCDLRLLKMEQTDPSTASAKMDLFGELLEEIIDGGHRALVFSQFVSMLGLIREQLDADGIPYCYLDGSTVDRGAVVERFQKQGDIPIFLISLKAGGTGLNLTGADTVIHFDPWWNPAVENQATDRAHRIGQTRVVTSYKLITRGTVEEKILHLQTRKAELIKGALGDEEALAQALTWDEIQELLS